MTFPTPGVDVAFTDAPWYAGGPTWTSVASQAQRIEISTGRAKDLDPFPPSVARVTLDNSDRRFDPEHAAGPYFGNLTANKKIRLSATHLGVTYRLFQGFVDGWPQDYMPPASGVCSTTAADMLKRLAKATPTWDIYADEVRADLPRAWWRMSETNGSIYNDFSGNGHDLKADDILGVASYAAESLIQAENGGAKLPTTGGLSAPMGTGPTSGSTVSVEFWIKSPSTPFTLVSHPPAFDFAPRLINGKPGPGATSTGEVFSASVMPNSGMLSLGRGVAGAILWYWQGATFPGVVGGSVSVMDGRIHHVCITRNGNTNIIYIDGADQTDYLTQVNATGSTANVPAEVLVNYQDPGNIPAFVWQDGPIIDEIAIYPQTLTADRVLAHYQAGSAPWDGQPTGTRILYILNRSNYPFFPGFPIGPTVDTGTMTLGPAQWSSGTTALGLLDQAEVSELGYLYVDHHAGPDVVFKDRTSRLRDTRSITSQATISDNPATGDMRYSALVGTYDQTVSVNSVTVKWVGGTAYASDATSITANGESGMSIDTVLPSLVTAQYFADGLLRRYKDPIGRFESIVIHPTTDALWVEVLSRRIGDRITVRRHPQSVGTAITFDCIVEGIDYEYSDGVDTFLATYHLSRADPVAYWILDTSALESTAILAF